jgi:hypothetical protein
MYVILCSKKMCFWVCFLFFGLKKFYGIGMTLMLKKIRLECWIVKEKGKKMIFFLKLG